MKKPIRVADDKSERAINDSKKSEIKTQLGLAKALGVSRQLIAARLKKPGAPPIGDLEAWQDFMAAFGREGGFATGDMRKKIAGQRLRLLTQMATRAERTNKLEDRKLINREEVSAYLVKAFALLFTRLDKRSDELPSIIQGLPADAVKAKLVASTEELKVELQRGFTAMFENGKTE